VAGGPGGGARLVAARVCARATAAGARSRTDACVHVGTQRRPSTVLSRVLEYS
jgi:hypothetical protein